MRDSEINFLQLNLQHKKAANSLLSVELSQNNIHIAIIQEPYIFKHSKIIPGLGRNYIAYFHDENATAAIIVRKDLKHTVLSKATTNRMVAIRIHTFDRSLIIVSCYASLSTASPIPVELEQHWPYFRRLSPNIIVGVDTNCHSAFLGYRKSDNRASTWEEFVVSKNLLILNNPKAITFENSRGHSSRIDWTISTISASSKLVKWQTPDHWISLSDHKAITYSFNLPPISRFRKVSNFNKADWSKFIACLEDKLPELENLSLCCPTEIDHFTETFLDIVKLAAERSVPKNKHIVHKNAWWTNALQRQKIQVRSLKRKNRADYLRKKFEFESEIQKAKNRSWQKFLENTNNQDDAYLRYKILCKSRTCDNLFPVEDQNGVRSTTPEESAKILLEKHFPDFAPNTEDDIEVVTTVKNFLETSHVSLEPHIESYEIIEAIKKTAPKKSPGKDGLPGIVFHKSLYTVLPYLKILFNKILEIGYYPQCWKTAHIVFLKKPGKEYTHDAKNFRPISLLPIISKIFDRIIQHRLNWFSTACRWTSRQQYGFQKSVSSEHAALNLSNFIMSGFKQRKETVAIFLDVSSAFNQIWHEGLIYKLIKKGVPPVYTKVLHSYLTNRSATVVIDEDSEVTKNLSQSCPQGAVLSPFLFNMFIDDLISSCIKYNSNIKIQAFADDIVLYMHKRKDQSAQEMNDLLRHVESWANKWHLRFNKDKTKAMLFSRLRKSQNELNLRFCDHLIEVTKQYKYLGIIFDSKLHWTIHLQYATAKAKKFIVQLNAASRLKWGLSPDANQHLYLNAIRPILLYGAVVWGNCLLRKSSLTLFQKTERIALLTITGALRTSPTIALYVLAGITPIKYLLRERIACEFHRLLTHNTVSSRLEINRVMQEHTKKFVHFSSLEVASDEFDKSGFKSCDIIQSKSLLDIPHPAFRSPLPIQLSNSAHNIEDFKDNAIFTDASKADGPVGFAVVQKNFGNWSVLCDGQLHDVHSVLQGELKAINSALHYLYDKLATGQFGIFSDSLSSLQALKQTDSLDPLVQDSIGIWSQLKIRNCHTKFFWVPGHANIEGNETADKAAKAAASSKEYTQIKPSYINKTILKRKLRSMTLSYWQFYWNFSVETGRFTYSLFPKVQTKQVYSNIQNRQDRILLYRAALGHFPINHYLHRFKLRNDDKCPFCKSSETIDHMLRDCFVYSRLRHEHLALLNISHHHISVKDYLTESKFLPLTIKILRQRLKYDNFVK